MVLPNVVWAESTPGQFVDSAKSEYYKARVLKLLGTQNEAFTDIPAFDSNIQNVSVKFLNGPEKDREMDVQYFPKSADSSQKLKVGETVYVMKTIDGANDSSYVVTERYRLNSLTWLALIFVILVIVIGRWKSFGSL
jgi:uncharacterized membrane protein